VGISLRLWTAEGARDLHEVGTLPVIHFSTASLLHSYPQVDQQVYLNYPQAYTQGASLGGPGAGLIGACSHAGPGSYAAVHRLPSLPSRLPSDLTGLTMTPSLIPSLIHLRPEPFGAHHLEQAAQVADPVDLTRTQPRRLGKRVGDDDDSPPRERKVRVRRIQRASC
jgi:hypothetical protein